MMNIPTCNACLFLQPLWEQYDIQKSENNCTSSIIFVVLIEDDLYSLSTLNIWHRCLPLCNGLWCVYVLSLKPVKSGRFNILNIPCPFYFRPAHDQAGPWAAEREPRGQGQHLVHRDQRGPAHPAGLEQRGRRPPEGVDTPERGTHSGYYRPFFSNSSAWKSFQKFFFLFFIYHSNWRCPSILHSCW